MRRFFQHLVELINLPGLSWFELNPMLGELSHGRCTVGIVCRAKADSLPPFVLLSFWNAKLNRDNRLFFAQVREEDVLDNVLELLIFQIIGLNILFYRGHVLSFLQHNFHLSLYSLTARA